VVWDDWIVLSASVISTWVPPPDELDGLDELDGCVAALAGLPQAVANRRETIITNNKAIFFIFTPLYIEGMAASLFTQIIKL
jgi:hypothetical protein